MVKKILLGMLIAFTYNVCNDVNAMNKALVYYSKNIINQSPWNTKSDNNTLLRISVNKDKIITRLSTGNNTNLINKSIPKNLCKDLIKYENKELLFPQLDSLLSIAKKDNQWKNNSDYTVYVPQLCESAYDAIITCYIMYNMKNNLNTFSIQLNNLEEIQKFQKIFTQLQSIYDYAQNYQCFFSENVITFAKNSIKGNYILPSKIRNLSLERKDYNNKNIIQGKYINEPHDENSKLINLSQHEINEDTNSKKSILNYSNKEEKNNRIEEGIITHRNEYNNKKSKLDDFSKTSINESQNLYLNNINNKQNISNDNNEEDENNSQEQNNNNSNNENSNSSNFDKNETDNNQNPNLDKSDDNNIFFDDKNLNRSFWSFPGKHDDGNDRYKLNWLINSASDSKIEDLSFLNIYKNDEYSDDDNKEIKQDIEVLEFNKKEDSRTIIGQNTEKNPERQMEQISSDNNSNNSSKEIVKENNSYIKEGEHNKSVIMNTDSKNSNKNNIAEINENQFNDSFQNVLLNYSNSQNISLQRTENNRYKGYNESNSSPIINTDLAGNNKYKISTEDEKICNVTGNFFEENKNDNYNSKSNDNIILFKKEEIQNNLNEEEKLHNISNKGQNINYNIFLQGDSDENDKSRNNIILKKK